MPRAMVFLSFVKMHEYILDYVELCKGVDRYKTVYYRQESGLKFWAIHGMADGYDNAIWTTEGWEDLDYYVEMYEKYHWESPTRGEPYKVYETDVQLLNFTIVDRVD